MSWAHRQVQDHRNAPDLFPACFRSSHPRALFDKRTSEFFLLAVQLSGIKEFFASVAFLQE